MKLNDIMLKLTVCVIAFLIVIAAIFVIHPMFSTKADSFIDDNKMIQVPTAGVATALNMNNIQEEEQVNVGMSCNIETSLSQPAYLSLSDSDKHMIAKLLWLEGRGECRDCQLRIVSVIVNRHTTSGMSIHDVVYDTNQFEPADQIDSLYLPDVEMNSMLSIVDEVLTYGPILPEYVTYFRADKFHKFKGQIPYIHHCNTYVSYDWSLYKSLGGQ